MISVAAVLASFIMQGRPEMMLVAVAAVLAVSALVGLINGLLVSRLQVSPFIATLGSGLILQGLLSASFTNFAGSVPIEFQAVAYGALGPLPYSVIGLFLLAILAAVLLRATKFGAHLYAVGGNAELLVLPDIGIKGNTHMLMQDDNSLDIADILLDWLGKHVTG